MTSDISNMDALFYSIVDSVSKSVPGFWNKHNFNHRDTLQCILCRKHVADIEEGTHGPILPDPDLQTHEEEGNIRSNEFFSNSLETPYNCNGTHHFTCQSCESYSQEDQCQDDCLLLRKKRVYCSSRNDSHPQSVIIRVPSAADGKSRVTNESFLMDKIHVSDHEYLLRGRVKYSIKAAIAEEDGFYALAVLPNEVQEFSKEKKITPRKNFLSLYGKNLRFLLYEKQNVDDEEKTNLAITEFFMTRKHGFKTLLKNIFLVPEESFKCLLSSYSKELVAIRQLAHTGSPIGRNLEVLQLCLQQLSLSSEPEKFIRLLPTVSINLAYTIYFSDTKIYPKLFNTFIFLFGQHSEGPMSYGTHE